MSRFDSVGVWWQDFPQQLRGGPRVEQVRNVPVPDTGWLPPKEFPNLSGAKVLSLDTETKDPELIERGPGGVRGAGHLIGASLATEDASWYFPIRHEYAPQQGLNLDPQKVLAWLKEVLVVPRLLVGANLMYDLEWLRAEGVTAPGSRFFDIQYAEPLLDEEARSYSLETIANKHFKEGKETPLLYQWCADSFGGPATAKQAANFWRAPPSLVGPYAETDARLPMRIRQIQQARLAEEGLSDLCDLECRLIPLLLDMRFLGVKIDVAKAEQLALHLRQQAAHFQAKIPGVDVWSNASLAQMFDREKIEYLRTEAGNPSFTKEWLTSCTHPIAQVVSNIRLFEKAANPFIESYLLNSHHQGRVHCMFHPLRSDDFGTVTGRLSSSNPNLQNIPSRNKELAPLLRGLFIPEEGCRWRRADHSQIEYRLLVHYAVGRGAEAMRERYRLDPDTDYHDLTIAMVQEGTGITLDRRPAKNLNFGLVYGMGKEKLTRSLGVSPDVGAQLYEAYFEALPAVRETLQSAQRLAARRGYIKTILGRRRRFNRLETDQFGVEQRSHTHKALNACLQGGAADIIKKGMVDCFEAGVFEVTGVPHLTVHDELDFSDENTAATEQAFKETKHILETCVSLQVPLEVKMDVGATWGDCL